MVQKLLLLQGTAIAELANALKTTVFVTANAIAIILSPIQIAVTIHLGTSIIMAIAYI